MSYRYKTKRLPKITPGHFLAFLVWPFGTFISALFNYRTPNSKTLFWLFCIFFGFTFVLQDEAATDADSVRHAAQFRHIADKPFNFDVLLTSFYNPKTGITDVYQQLATWLVANLTNDPRWLFALFAAVFGYFYTQNLWLIFKRIDRKFDILLFVFILYFALINPIWHINGARMWTAAQIFFYGILIYFLEGKKQGLIWCASSILFHFSFIFPVAVLIGFLFLPINTRIIFAFFIITSFIKEINLSIVRDSLSFLPQVFQTKVEGYTNEGYAESINESSRERTWHVLFTMYFRIWVLYTWIIVVFIKYKNWLDGHPNLKQLFNFGLFFGSFAQIASLIPSGGRFIIIYNLVFFTIFVLLLAQKFRPLLITKLARVSLPFLIFAIIFLIRMGTEFMGFLTLFGNPVLAAMFEEKLPLISYIKNLF